ncbi:hypothetical protein ACFY0N_37080 [Streptomyces vinaceus]|uniref:hypothetical protein n=1 Tax=Streptomyces vinaceus TaxID=1960 RepID=UPI0035E348AC
MIETIELLDVLLDGVSAERHKLISEDEAKAMMVLLGILETGTRVEEVRRAAGELRFRLASRLAAPASHGAPTRARVAPLALDDGRRTRPSEA